MTVDHGDGVTAHEKVTVADGKKPKDVDEDTLHKSATEIILEVRENGGYRCKYDLADIAVTLAVAPRGPQGDCIFNLSPRARRCREYPDREDRPKRHRISYDAVGGQIPKIINSMSTANAATALPAQPSWATWIWKKMGKWLLDIYQWQ